MTPYNSHNKDLVNKINELWNSEETHDRFRIILVAYMQRDLEEMLEKNCFGDCGDDKVVNENNYYYRSDPLAVFGSNISKFFQIIKNRPL